MNKSFLVLILTAFVMVSCASEQTDDKLKGTSMVTLDVDINAPTNKVWDILTSPEYAKILGNEFDKNAYMESDWKLGSKVYFKYEPDTTMAFGTISRLIEDKLIQIDYDFDDFTYTEKFMLEAKENNCVMKLKSGPYGSDYTDQIEVWGNWLQKIKELSETEATSD
jgi:hypothetical protein